MHVGEEAHISHQLSPQGVLTSSPVGFLMEVTPRGRSGPKQGNSGLHDTGGVAVGGNGTVRGVRTPRGGGVYEEVCAWLASSISRC